jgi:hypothetical protein
MDNVTLNYLPLTTKNTMQALGDLLNSAYLPHLCNHRPSDLSTSLTLTSSNGLSNTALLFAGAIPLLSSDAWEHMQKGRPRKTDLQAFWADPDATLGFKEDGPFSRRMEHFEMDIGATFFGGELPSRLKDAFNGGLLALLPFLFCLNLPAGQLPCDPFHFNPSQINFLTFPAHVVILSPKAKEGFGVLESTSKDFANLDELMRLFVIGGNGIEPMNIPWLSVDHTTKHKFGSVTFTVELLPRNRTNTGGWKEKEVR